MCGHTEEALNVIHNDHGQRRFIGVLEDLGDFGTLGRLGGTCTATENIEISVQYNTHGKERERDVMVHSVVLVMFFCRGWSKCNTYQPFAQARLV
jgi:hypothetical protein